MKKKIEYYEHYCDRCNKKVCQLYGNQNGYLVELDNIDQAQNEECRIIPAYYLRQNGGRSANFRDSGICRDCLRIILKRTLSKIEQEQYDELKKKRSLLMNYSRATRQQLQALDLIQGLVDASQDANRSDTAVDQCVRRLSKLQHDLRSRLAEVNDRGGIVFENRKQYERYRRELQALRQIVLDYWTGPELDGREYVNAVLVLVDEITRQAGKTKQAWGEVLAEIQRLYELFDPDLEATDQMESGERVSEKFKEVSA